MTRIPLLYDARIVVAEPGEDDLVLRPPLPRESLDDVGQAVRDALQFPLAGEPLEPLVKPGGTATIVIEQPSLPIPAVQFGPRHVAIAAVADELERLGVRQTTILVAGALMRRTTPRDIGTLVPPEFRRGRGSRPARTGRQRPLARQPGAGRDGRRGHGHRR
jgi:hypothetical protein